MIDALRPWIGVAVGLMITMLGIQRIRKPMAFVGRGLVPASDPRTVRIFGVAFLIIGGLNFLLHFYGIVSE